MSYNSNKIPYDNEPINRNINKEQEKKHGISFVDSLQFIICLILVVAVVLTYSKITKLENERTIYNLDISSTESTGLATAASKGMLSTVNVGAMKREYVGFRSMKTTDDFFDNNSSWGSGVIYKIDESSGDAWIITNYHVVANSSSASYKNGYGAYSILLWDGDAPLSATLVGGSSTYDIAVLKISDLEAIQNSSCRPADIAVSTEIAVGDSCVAIGNSRANNLRVSTGVVSVEEMPFRSTSGDNVTFLSHSAPINGGNSGGGLYNSNGELIGIVNAKYADVNDDGTIKDEVVQGIFYAIPSSIAVSVAKNIIRNDGTLKKPNIGLSYGKTYEWKEKSISISDADGRFRTNYSLKMLQSVGKFLVADEIISVSYTLQNGNIVEDVLDHMSSIESHIYNWDKNMTISFKIKRAGITRTIDVMVDETIDVA